MFQAIGKKFWLKIDFRYSTFWDLFKKDQSQIGNFSGKIKYVLKI